MTALSRSRRRRIVGAIGGAVCLATFAVACGNKQSVVQGARYSTNRETLEIASIMPTCGCIRLAMTRTEPQILRDNPALKRPDVLVDTDVVLVARRYGLVIGSPLVLKPGDPVEVQTDWAGVEPRAVYEVAAYEAKPLVPNNVVNRDGQGGANDPSTQLKPGLREADLERPLTPISSYVVTVGDIIPTDCSDTALCSFKPLLMNKASTADIGQGDIETQVRGVRVTRGDQAIDVAASVTTCGCIAILVGDEAIELRSSYRGQALGTMSLDAAQLAYIAFDEAGPSPDDVYVVMAADRSPAVAPTDRHLLEGGVFTERNRRIGDVLSIVGRMDRMECAPDRSAALLPLPPDSVQALPGSAKVEAPPGGAPLEAPPGGANVELPGRGAAAGARSNPAGAAAGRGGGGRGQSATREVGRGQIAAGQAGRGQSAPGDAGRGQTAAGGDATAPARTTLRCPFGTLQMNQVVTDQRGPATGSPK